MDSSSDRLRWLLAVFDSFLVSLARQFLDNCMPITRGTETFWNNCVPINLNVLLWRMRLYSIPTRERLSYRVIVLDSILCHICSNEVKTINHIFTGCVELRDI